MYNKIQSYLLHFIIQSIICTCDVLCICYLICAAPEAFDCERLHHSVRLVWKRSGSRNGVAKPQSYKEAHLFARNIYVSGRKHEIENSHKVVGGCGGEAGIVRNTVEMEALFASYASSGPKDDPNRTVFIRALNSFFGAPPHFSATTIHENGFRGKQTKKYM